MDQLLAHSPFGASVSKRGIECSRSILAAMGIIDESSDHAREGTAAHAVIEEALRDGLDAWRLIGQDREGFGVSAEMADACQVWLDKVRQRHPDMNQGNTWIERKFHCPTIHRLFYGTSDLIYIDDESNTLHVWDYKHGAGIVVEAENNPQAMYYGAAALETLGMWDYVEQVVLHIVQPRAPHHAGPHREWQIATSDLVTWLEDTLVPAMNRAERGEGDFNPGDHCRFCPVRFRDCPGLSKAMDELEVLMEEIKQGGVEALSSEKLGRYLDLCEQAKIVGKAAQSEAFNRAQGGKAVPGWKLAKAKAFRQWREVAEDPSGFEFPIEELARRQFGDDAFEPAKFKSPAQLEKLPKGEAFVARHAFKPDAGLTLVRDTDNRPAVSRDTKAMFQPVKKTKAA